MFLEDSFHSGLQIYIEIPEIKRHEAKIMLHKMAKKVPLNVEVFVKFERTDEIIELYSTATVTFVNPVKMDYLTPGKCCNKQTYVDRRWNLGGTVVKATSYVIIIT